MRKILSVSVIWSVSYGSSGCHERSPIRTKCWAWTAMRRRLTSGERICVWSRDTIPTRTPAIRRLNGSLRRFRARTTPCAMPRESERVENRNRHRRASERNVTNRTLPRVTGDSASRNGPSERITAAHGNRSLRPRVNPKNVRERRTPPLKVAAPSPNFSTGLYDGVSGLCTARTHFYGPWQWQDGWKGCLSAPNGSSSIGSCWWDHACCAGTSS